MITRNVLNFNLSNKFNRSISSYLFLSTRNFSSDLNQEPIVGPNLKTNNEKTVQNQKLIRVAVLGVPNAGKSTFINNLINRRVCPTSNKVHTTRKANKAIHTEKDTQIIFFDTPGLVTEREIRKHNLESTFTSSYRHSLQNADLCCVLHDISNKWTRNELHSTILKALETYSKIPSFLVLNKIDLMKSKRILLQLIKKLTNDTLSNKKRIQVMNDPNILANSEVVEKPVGWSNFSEVFMVSSITGDGLNEIMNSIVNLSKPNQWQFSSSTFTDESPENLIVETVRARLLDYLPQEIPYLLKCEIEYYSVENKVIYASVIVYCPSSRIERLICGESDGKLKQITERATSDLVETFGKPISLTITTKHKKSETALKQ